MSETEVAVALGVFAVVAGLAGVGLGWRLNRGTAREERQAEWSRQLEVRKAQVLASLTQVLDGYDLSSRAVRDRDSLETRREFFDAWKRQLDPIGHELRTISFLESDQERKGQGFDTARAVAMLVLVLDLATGETATPGIIDEVDKRVSELGGEVNALGGYWKPPANEAAASDD